MGLLNRKPPESANPVLAAAAEKKAAAERLSASLAEAGVAFEALFAADRAYLAAYRQEYGAEAFSGSLLMNRFRGMLLCDLELNAPELLKYLNQPRQSRARCSRISDQIARQVDNDLSSLPQPKDPVT